MWPVLRLNLKRNKIFVGFWILIFLSTFFDNNASGLLLLMFSWLFLYRYNVEDKAHRSFEFFQSLPITLNQKIFLKIIFPMLVVLSVAFSTYKFAFAYHIMNGDYADHLLTASVLTFASLVAQSLSGYIFIGLSISFLSKILSNVTYVNILASIVLIALSILELSGRRKNSSKLIAITSSLAIVLLIGFHLSKNVFLNHWLQSSDGMTSLFSAKILMQDGDKKAQIILGDKLFDSQDDQTVSIIIDSFEDSKDAIPFDEVKLKKLLQKNPVHREKILEYVNSHLADYRWINFTSLKDLEDIILLGDDECVDACFELAKIYSSLGGISDAAVMEFLKSPSYQRVHYGMKIIERAKLSSPAIKNAVLEVITHESPIISESAIELAKSWYDSNLEDTKKELTQEGKLKIQEFFKSKSL